MLEFFNIMWNQIESTKNELSTFTIGDALISNKISILSWHKWQKDRIVISTFLDQTIWDLGTVSQFYSQSTVISKFQNNLHTHYPVICNMFDVTWRREGSCCFFGGCQDMQLAKGMNMLSCYIYHTLLYSSACEELAWS